MFRVLLTSSDLPIFRDESRVNIAQDLGEIALS